MRNYLLNVCECMYIMDSICYFVIFFKPENNSRYSIEKGLQEK